MPSHGRDEAFGVPFFALGSEHLLFVCMFVCLFVCLFVWFFFLPVCVCVCVCARVCVCVCVCVALFCNFHLHIPHHSRALRVVWIDSTRQPLTSERLTDNGVTDWDAAFVCRTVVAAETDDELMDLQYVRIPRVLCV